MTAIKVVMDRRGFYLRSFGPFGHPLFTNNIARAMLYRERKQAEHAAWRASLMGRFKAYAVTRILEESQ